MDILFLTAIVLAGSLAQSLVAFCIALFTVPMGKDDITAYVVNRYDTLLTFDDIPTV